MRQLTGLDALFLAHEGSRTVGHVASFVVLDSSERDGGAVTVEDVRAMIDARLPLLPTFRWRLAEVPFDLDHHYWVDDPDFDLDYHVRETALAPPGGDKALAALVGRIFSQRMDRRRPLWESWLIHGLEGGRQALFSKIHHAVVDGVSGAEILGAILDLSPEGRDPADIPERTAPPAEMPSPGAMLVRGVAGTPRRVGERARALPSVVGNLAHLPGAGWVPGARTVGRVAKAALGPVLGDELPMLEPATGAAPRTPFNRRLSGHLKMAHVKLDLEEVKEVKAALETTVNDVVVSIAAGGVRRWLLEHDALPDEPLLALVPVSVRTEEEVGTYGNRVSGMVVPIPTHVERPTERLGEARGAMLAAKQRHDAVPATMLVDATKFLPPAIFARAAKLTIGIAGATRPPMNLIVSNVPGPQVPLYCLGAKVETVVPVSPVTHGVGMNITVMSYCGRVDAGIVVDREHVPDPGVVARGMREELDALREAAGLT